MMMILALNHVFNESSSTCLIHIFSMTLLRLISSLTLPRRGSESEVWRPAEYDINNKCNGKNIVIYDTVDDEYIRCQRQALFCTHWQRASEKNHFQVLETGSLETGVVLGYCLLATVNRTLYIFRSASWQWWEIGDWGFKTFCKHRSIHMAIMPFFPVLCGCYAVKNHWYKSRDRPGCVTVSLLC